MKKISVLIPLYNGEKTIGNLLSMLLRQKLNKGDQLEVIIIDSNSTDNSIEIVKNNFPNVKISSIPNKQFDHGGTRNILASQANGEFLLFMTQDAVPVDEYLIENLVAGFKQDRVEICFARQIPYDDASQIEKFARGFNYPARNIIKNKEKINELGIKTFFNSNVCSMYKRDVFDKLGGFPEKIILNEDMIFASKVIFQGAVVLYCAEAKVYHSHNYSVKQQFKRYFDIGMAFDETKYLLEMVSNEKEGFKFLIELVKHLLRSGNVFLIPTAFLETVAKFVGYNLGKKHSFIPYKLKRKLSAYMK
jgi:rhamnosyltransferase